MSLTCLARAAEARKAGPGPHRGHKRRATRGDHGSRISNAIPASRQCAPYVEADWGFKNTWYPALFSHELGENGVKGVTMAGHDIALRRSRGRVYALRDRCAHRGVKMSLRPMCLTAETLSC